MKKFILYATFICAFAGCKKNEPVSITTAEVTNGANIFPSAPAKWFQGTKPYYLPAGWVGDVMPYFDKDSFHVFYLHDARDGAAGFHPWNKFTTSDFTSYQYGGVMIPYGSTSDQDLALGTGSIVKVGDTYYAYYSGFNPSFNGSGGKFRDVILLATSKDLLHWQKVKDFIIKPETANGYDYREFRDPYVFFNSEKNEYWMLVCGRKDGKAAVMLYTSPDPVQGNWQLKNPVYSDDAYYVPETPQILKWGQWWYLIFSENSAENVTHYRMASSSGGPWTKPVNDKLDGSYMYASKIASNSTDSYLFGWCPTKSGSSDAGSRDFGGNLVVHHLKQNTDGTLGINIPATIEKAVSRAMPLNLVVKRQDVGFDGSVVSFKKTDDEAMLLFERLQGTHIITATASGIETGSEFGFVFGMDKTLRNNNYYKMSVNEAKDELSAIAVINGVPRVDAKINFSIQPAAEHQIKLAVNGSVCVLYIDGKVALSSRIYSANNSPWGFFATKGNIVFKNISLLSQ